MTVFAFADLKSPMPAIRSPRIATSACSGLAPVPSYSVPPRTITSKSSLLGDGDGSCANTVKTIVRKAPSQRKFCFIAEIVVDD